MKILTTKGKKFKSVPTLNVISELKKHKNNIRILIVEENEENFLDELTRYKLFTLEKLIFNNNSIKKIFRYSFMYIKTLREVKLPDNLLGIYTAAFLGCTNLTNIKLPNSIIRINKNAFSKCIMLEDVNIPLKIRVIEEYAFSNSGIKRVEIPKSCKYIDRKAFYNCPNLREVIFHKRNNRYISISRNVFSSCTSLEFVEFSDGLDEIPAECFLGCEKLAEITLPQSLEIIGEGAFNYCSNIKEINIPKKVSYISDTAFYGCKNLEKIIINSEELRFIGRYAFSCCTQLTKIIFNPNIKLEEIPIACFENSECLEEIEIPNSTGTIGNRAFKNCKNLKKIKFPEKLRAIAESAFENCSSLEEIILSSKYLNIIGSNAFKSCKSLKLVKIDSINLSYSTLLSAFDMDTDVKIYVLKENGNYIKLK